MTEKEQLKRTPFHDRHVAAGAKMTPFGGWEMPLHYGSQVAEHHAVRQKVGMFDVSHMGQIDARGRRAEALVQLVVANDVEGLEIGQSLYSPMCSENGGVLDDLIVTRLAEDHFFIVVNASTQEDDFEHMRQIARRHGLRDAMLLSFESSLWSMIAVQGPEAEKALSELIPGVDWSALPYFHVQRAKFRGAGGLVSRTGYTGEDGFEILLPPEAGVEAWDALAEQGVPPCGLAARDTLRLEAGYLLSGQDMDESVNAIEAGLGWACKEEKDSAPVGARALRAARANKDGRRLAGLEMEGRAIPRHGDQVLSTKGEAIGHITSGTFSPTLQKGIALAYLDMPHHKKGTDIAVKVRGKAMPGVVARPPFVKDTSIKSKKPANA